MREGDALPTIEKMVTQDRIGNYAKASGDFNPIHLDHDFASKSQFGGTIAHGMMIAASISEMMAVAFKENWLRGGRLKIKFRAVVYPGDIVTTFGQVKSMNISDAVRQVTCAVGVRKQDGEVVITGGATVTVAVGDGMVENGSGFPGGRKREA